MSRDRNRPGSLFGGLRRLRAQYSDLPADDQRLLRGHELMGWAVALGVLAVYVLVGFVSEALFTSPGERLVWRFGVMAVLASVIVGFTLRRLQAHTAQHLRDQQAMRQAQERAAQLQGALLAARTMQHHLSNELALTSGYAELLATDPRLPPELRVRANEAVHGVQRAIESLEQLSRLQQIEADALAGPPLLALEHGEQPPRR